ncbi:hypothetical protein K440DRAFT_520099, partial [Wilcoxina mikolae CBS 423.85]
VDNFYTTDPTGEFALQHGYQFLGIACYLFDTQVSNTLPVYRCFKPSNGNYFYTTHCAEFDKCVNIFGFRAEHIGWFMFGQDQCRSKALNRYYNDGTGDHKYCTDNNISKVSHFKAYRKEGVAGYVL